MAEWKDLKSSREELATELDEILKGMQKIGKLGALQSLTGAPSMIPTIVMQTKIQCDYFELILRELQELNENLKQLKE
jgi:hypothetical protein